MKRLEIVVESIRYGLLERDREERAREEVVARIPYLPSDPYTERRYTHDHAGQDEHVEPLQGNTRPIGLEA